MINSTKEQLTGDQQLVDDEDSNNKQFDRIADSGQPDGLFRSCMGAIRSAHVTSNRIRAAIVVAGLFTDVQVYREIILAFYVVTRELEIQLDATTDVVGEKLKRSLDYRFTVPYEHDLDNLYKQTDWRKDALSQLLLHNPAVEEYRSHVAAMQSGVELAGAVFCLWGALIVGGGAAAKPRVESRYGKDVVHLFSQVTGPGREKRKRDFVRAWDGLAVMDEKPISPTGQNEFEMIVESSRQCMSFNNSMITSLRRDPW